MNQRNCPNCGAPYDVSLNKCPYCNTSYFDLSCIDINDRQPFYLKLRMGDMIITQRVIVNPDVSIEITNDEVYACDRIGTRLHSFTKSKSVLTSLTFTALPDNKGKNLVLYTVEYEGELDEKYK